MDLFRRHPANPILSASDWPYRVNAVFNPGAVRLSDGRTLLLCRCELYDGTSHLTVATSDDGKTDWRIETTPTLAPAPNDPTERYGTEDPRLIFVPELDRYAVIYCGYGEDGPGVSLALTKDFAEFERLGRVLPPDDKDASLYPRRIGGRWAMIHRPIRPMSAYMWISYSDDLKTWTDTTPLLRPRGHGLWDGGKLGLSTPPMETEQGWLLLYHAVRVTAAGAIYRTGAALFDLDDPTKLIRRGHEWVLGPQYPYEREGDVGNVVFPCGWTVGPDLDLLHVYYGAADMSIGLAEVRLSELVDWLLGEGGAG